MTLTRFKTAFCAALLACSGLATAAFPDKPVRLIVPFPAGGAADVMARGMAQRLGTELGQPIVIDNRGGAGGTTAAEGAAKSPADGYTLFFGTMGTHAINPALYAKLRYDPLKDFAPISLTHTTPRVLVVGPSVPAKNIAELIALAKKGTLTYGSAGNGSSSHLAGALFEALTGVKMLHVPYKGSSPLLVDLLAGRVDLTFDSYAVYEQHIKNGKVAALGVTSTTRMGALPQVPTIAEAGVKGYDVSNWLGLFAPAGTPKDVLIKIHSALGRAMAAPELKTQLVVLGIEPTFGTPEAFAALIRAELPKWAEIVKKSGASVE
ncbi:Bug family tripartite tricarboxylate transporter substrate binding protein [Variovorax fucosicus]|uniref:Bug family tripartite tricarboxylate transporter substrate binding protein n=1 Tax=Variovorax fucosicus TaxID=3053517 RepID=UPI002578F044|nr:tripartite tricarboxylate transporter substrate binding protein [Variovorax sp. J22G47]MDM0056454.1 tripartite tricarboxylate transporter substrate binding protein [Variovorax sp. J22G47]